MSLESAPLPYAPTGRAFLQHVRTRYLLFSLLLATLTALLLAWHWSQPRQFYNGYRYSWALIFLLIAALLIHSIAYFFQQRYLHRQIQQIGATGYFALFHFAVRLYLYHLATALVLAVICFYPLLLTLFYYWIYPLAFWFVPYPLLSGLMLGWEVKRSLPTFPAIK